MTCSSSVTWVLVLFRQNGVIFVSVVLITFTLLPQYLFLHPDFGFFFLLFTPPPPGQATGCPPTSKDSLPPALRTGPCAFEKALCRVKVGWGLLLTYSFRRDLGGRRGASSFTLSLLLISVHIDKDNDTSWFYFSSICLLFCILSHHSRLTGPTSEILEVGLLMSSVRSG